MSDPFENQRKPTAERWRDLGRLAASLTAVAGTVLGASVAALDLVGHGTAGRVVVFAIVAAVLNVVVMEFRFAERMTDVLNPRARRDDASPSADEDGP